MYLFQQVHLSNLGFLEGGPGQEGHTYTPGVDCWTQASSIWKYFPRRLHKRHQGLGPGIRAITVGARNT